MKKNFQNAFSLMEMMIVLLIVAIIAAATAPMVTKKMVRTAGSGDSPWVFTGLNNNIAYNMAGSDNATAIIGAASLPSGWNQHTRLFIDSGDNASHIAFGNGNEVPLLLTADPDRDKGRVGFSNATIPESSVAFGTNQTLGNSKIVAVGASVNCGSESVAIGYGANANVQQGVAIGNGANATRNSAIAIGNGTSSSSIAIGAGASSTESNSIAIGAGAQATSANSVAIGTDVATTTSNQIALGTASDTVYIRGRLVVDHEVVVGRLGGAFLFNRANMSDNESRVRFINDGLTVLGKKRTSFEARTSRDTINAENIHVGGGSNFYNSDRRLKNVGEKYTAGLEELKKLDFYHYTFKDDKDNTPLVGVMAQDLQKVFPDAVTKGDDGYLRIRLEDMFYAVINAVKELDNKISEIIINISGINSKIENLEKENAELQKENSELKAEIKGIEKRIEKLESLNNKKLFK